MVEREKRGERWGERRGTQRERETGRECEREERQWGNDGGTERQVGETEEEKKLNPMVNLSPLRYQVINIMK